ncbi:MAG: hypothetical protein ACLFMS_01905 [Halorhodospira sp.]
MPALREALSGCHGGCSVHVDYRHPQGRGRVVLGRDWAVTPSDDLIKRLEGVVDGPVSVEYPR